jgi:hypothetical protein
MSITFACDQCGKPFTLDDKFAGKKGRCKECGAIMQIPAPARSVRAVDREIAPSRRAPERPAPAQADVYGFEDEPLPPRSTVGVRDEEFDASGPEKMLYPKRPGLYPAPSRPQSSGGGQATVKIILRVVLGVVGGLAGLVGAAVGIPGLRSLVTPGWSSRSQIEVFIKRQADLTNELTGILRTVTDVPTATEKSSRANATVRKLTENLRSNKDRKGNQKDIDDLKQKYAFQQRQALQDFTGEIQRIAMIPGALDALAIQETLMEQAAIEETIPGINKQAGFNPPSNSLENFRAPPAPTIQRVQIPGTGFNPQPGMNGPGPDSGPQGPAFRRPGMPPGPNFPGPRGRVRSGGPGLGPP